MSFFFSACENLDIVFVIDSSGSINTNDAANWDRLLQFCADIVDSGRYVVNQDNTRFAAIRYSNNAETGFLLDAHDSKEATSDALKSLPYFGGTTNIAHALELTRTEILQVNLKLNTILCQCLIKVNDSDSHTSPLCFLFQTNNGDRASADNLVILITDGIPNEREADTLTEAQLLKDTGAHVVCIGITNEIDANLLSSISSDGDYIFIEKFTDFGAVLDELQDQTCNLPAPGMKFLLLPARFNCALCSMSVDSVWIPLGVPLST